MQMILLWMIWERLGMETSTAMFDTALQQSTLIKNTGGKIHTLINISDVTCLYWPFFLLIALWSLICHLSLQERMDGIESARRNRTVEENLQIWGEMEKASEVGLKNCIRYKMDMQVNKALRIWFLQITLLSDIPIKQVLFRNVLLIEFRNKRINDHWCA